jgi:hypothetical protein
MNLPSNHPTEEQGLIDSSSVSALEGNRHGADPCSSTPAERSSSREPQVRSQFAPRISLLALGFISVGLHVWALIIPLPRMQPISSKPNQAIKVTRLAVAPKPKRSPPKNLSAKVKTSAQTSAPAPSPRPQNRLPSRTAIASLRQVNPSPTPAASPKPSPTLQSSPPASPAPTQSQPPDPEFKDFPTYPGAALSPESPALSTSDDFKKVADYFDQALFANRNQKWATQVTIDKPSQRKVYQVSQGGATKFLSLFSKGPLGTAYVLADRPTTEEDLSKAEQAIANLGDILGSLKGIEPTDGSLTAQPELFSRVAAIQSMNFIDVAPPEKVFQQYLSIPLDQNRFEVPSLPQSYGGGLLYPLKRGSFTSYLNLVPSKDGTGTIIILWRTPPA